MDIIKFAKLLKIKYAVSDANALEKSLRSDIAMLYKYPHELFNILEACAKASPSGAVSEHEKKVVAGAKFCENLLFIIDYLFEVRETISLNDLKMALNELIRLIESHRPIIDDKKSVVDLSDVSALIFEMIRATTVSERTKRDQQFAKARAGVSRILSFALSMLEKISKIEMTNPDKFISFEEENEEANRFKPKRAPLSVYDIVDFIRQHGPEYGIKDREDWGKVFRNNPQMKEEMTTIINAINRGHYPSNAPYIKEKIEKILKGAE
jgi:hypothetical protein